MYLFICLKILIIDYEKSDISVIKLQIMCDIYIYIYINYIGQITNNLLAATFIIDYLFQRLSYRC